MENSGANDLLTKCFTTETGKEMRKQDREWSSRVQDTLPRNMAPWHPNCLKPKEFEKPTEALDGLSDLTLLPCKQR